MPSTLMQPTPSFDDKTPFLLIARATVKPGQADAYLAAAKEVDDAVNETEPGMLHHTFDQDPNDPNTFVWSEVYENDAAFPAHLANSSVGVYLGKHAELCDGPLSVEVYGTVSEECRKTMESTGLPLKIFESKLGYTRIKSVLNK